MTVAKHQQEIRDPIHNFVRLSADEITAINSPPFQRLRYIHQLALTYLIYPGATHRRFEHSLGVMELAGRVFDVLTAEGNRHPSIQFPDRDTLIAWRKVVRLAALFHDLGHLPFSHAAEQQLLTDGKHHEWLTVGVLRSPQVRAKTQNIDFPVELDSHEISTSIAESTIYAEFKPATVGFVFVSPNKRKDAEKWLGANKKKVLSEQMELDL